MPMWTIWYFEMACLHVAGVFLVLMQMRFYGGTPGVPEYQMIEKDVHEEGMSLESFLGSEHNVNLSRITITDDFTKNEGRSMLTADNWALQVIGKH